MPSFRRRDLQRRLQPILVGLLAGALAGFLLLELGLREIVGYPPAQLVLFPAAIAGALLGGVRLQRIVLILDVCLALGFLVVADTPMMYALATRWVRQDRIESRVDAIVVLSADVNSDGMLSDQGVQRLLTGLTLFQDHVAPRLFTTAVDNTFGAVVRSSTADQERLITLGGARAAWTSLTGVHTTHDEATQAAAQLPTGVHTVAVVTAPLHTRRACATFEAVGFRVVCVPSREQEWVAWHPVTARDRLESFRQYLYERLGMVKYRAKGWLPKER